MFADKSTNDCKNIMVKFTVPKIFEQFNNFFRFKCINYPITIVILHYYYLLNI